MSEHNKISRLAFTLPEVLLVVCICAFLVWVFVPNYCGFHTSPANACINNLRQIDAAANQFALEHHLTNGDAIHFPTSLTPYIKLNSAGKIPGCPLGGSYSIKKNWRYSNLLARLHRHATTYSAIKKRPE